MAAALMGQTQEQMAALALQARSAQEPKKRYAFWETQPVSQFDETAASVRPRGRSLDQSWRTAWTALYLGMLPSVAGKLMLTAE